MVAPTLYYDGPCHLCQGSVKWVRQHVPGVTCLPLQSEEARSTLPTELCTPPLTGVVVVDSSGNVHVGHRGLRALAPYAQPPWKYLLRVVPGWGYYAVARTRRLWGRDDACSIE